MARFNTHKDTVSILADILTLYTQEEIKLAMIAGRTLKEFDEDELNNLERLNNIVMLKQDHLRKHGMA